MKKLLLLFVLLFSTMNYAQTEAVEKVSDVVQKQQKELLLLKESWINVQVKHMMQLKN